MRILIFPVLNIYFSPALCVLHGSLRFSFTLASVSTNVIIGEKIDIRLYGFASSRACIDLNLGEDKIRKIE